MAVEVGQKGPQWELRAGRPEDHALFVRLFAELGGMAPPHLRCRCGSRNSRR